MANLNKVFLIGNLTRDPELKSLGSGSVLCQFGMAINRTYRTSDGMNREETCFVDVTFWGKAAEIIHRFVRKGRPLLVEGRLKYERWDGADGRPRSKLSVVGENFQFLGSPPGRDGYDPNSNRGFGSNYNAYPDYGSVPTAHPSASTPPPPSGSPAHSPMPGSTPAPTPPPPISPPTAPITPAPTVPSAQAPGTTHDPNDTELPPAEPRDMPYGDDVPF